MSVHYPATQCMHLNEYNILEHTLYICKKSKVKIIFPICERQI